MSPDDAKMFDEYFELFSTPGWKRLMGDLQENIDATDTLRVADNEKELWYGKGKLDVLEDLVNLPTMMENVYDDRVEEEKRNEVV